MLKDFLNKANSLMNTANNTANSVNRTKQSVNSLGGQNRQMQQREANKKRELKAAQKAAEWKCECGKKNHAKFCEHCGKSKPACHSCGADATGSKFCAQCGADMTAPPVVDEVAEEIEEVEEEVEEAPAVCDGCGAKVCGARFCPECGIKVGE